MPGTPGPVEKFEDVKAFTDEYGFPIIIKAAFGGGGRGMRVVREQETLKDSFERATSEAKSAFGNGTVFVERFLDKPKHIEVQLLGDNLGNVVHLYERDCSVQRRHQKVVEIAPAKDLPVETRDAILADAVRLAQSVKYRNAGTAEFLVDQQNRYYFIEVSILYQCVQNMFTEYSADQPPYPGRAHYYRGSHRYRHCRRTNPDCSWCISRAAWPDSRPHLYTRLCLPMPNHHRRPRSELRTRYWKDRGLPLCWW